MPVNSLLPDLDLLDLPLHQFICDGLKLHKSSIALIDGETGETWLGSRVLRETESLAAGLQIRFGIRKNDVILFFLPNCPRRHAIALLATLTTGAVVSGCNPIYNTDELMRQMLDCNPVVVFTDAAGIEVTREAALRSKIKSLKVVVVEDSVALKTGEYSMDVLMNTCTTNFVVPVIDTKSDVALMPYSSGTTGVPKGTMITHFNKVAQLQTLNNHAFFLCPMAGDTTVIVVPFFHLFGLMILLPALREGVTVVTVRKFTPELFLKHIQDYKVRMLYIVPPLVLLLAKHPAVSKYDISSLHTIVVAAAPLGEVLSKELCAKHPNIKYLIQAYGLTEITGAATVMLPKPLNKLPFASCGVLVSNSQAMIVDIKTGKELGPNEDGELWWRGPGVMKGYLSKPEQTAATIDAQGWVHTGDIAHYDEDGYFYIVDRLKELIKVKGFQVAPAELEDHLLNLHEVADAAVVGVPDEKAGELPVAFVVKKQGSAVSANHIMRSINEHVASYKRIKTIYFIEEIPKSPSGKILRRILREKLKKSKL